MPGKTLCFDIHLMNGWAKTKLNFGNWKVRLWLLLASSTFFAPGNSLKNEILHSLPLTRKHNPLFTSKNICRFTPRGIRKCEPYFPYYRTMNSKIFKVEIQGYTNFSFLMIQEKEVYLENKGFQSWTNVYILNERILFFICTHTHTHTHNTEL